MSETPIPDRPLEPGSVRVIPGPQGTVAVCEALPKVMAELPNIGKDAKSPEGYMYRGIEAVTRHLQPLFAKHGLFVVPDGRITGVVPSPAMKDGWQDVYMTVAWTVVASDGSSLVARTNGIGRDRTDKGANKAQTQAFKYLLIHVLCIADGKDDTDSLTYEDGRAADLIPTPDAKRTVLAACGGDKDAAGAAWTAAKLDGRKAVSAAELEAALANIDQPKISAGAEPRHTGDAAGGREGTPGFSPGVQPGVEAAEAPAGNAPADKPKDINPRVLAIYAAKVFGRAAEKVPDVSKSKVTDRLRYALTHSLTDGRTVHLDKLTDAERDRLWDRLHDIDQGDLTFDFNWSDAHGVTFAGEAGGFTVLWSEFERQEAEAPA
jgi:hypothetical protein